MQQIGAILSLLNASLVGKRQSLQCLKATFVTDNLFVIRNSSYVAQDLNPCLSERKREPSMRNLVDVVPLTQRDSRARERQRGIQRCQQRDIDSEGAQITVNIRRRSVRRPIALRGLSVIKRREFDQEQIHNATLT